MSDTDTTTAEQDDTGQAEQDSTPDRSSSKRKRKRARDSKPKKGGTTARGDRRARSLKRPLEEMFTGLGATVAVFNQFDGQCIVAGAPELAKAMDALAKQDPAVQRALERLVAGSTWGQVITAAASVAMPIAANHGALPPPMLGAGVGAKAMKAMDIDPTDLVPPDTPEGAEQ